MKYIASSTRYDNMAYQRCGQSGLKIPTISLGLWQNFGAYEDLTRSRNILQYAFDNGITHFDLANNYGPPPGSAEETFGRIMEKDFRPYRDEMIISTKAGYLMWPGPYGEFGSRKYMMASLDQSLLRMKLEYVDIFYSHRPDPDTPLEETMGALDSAIKQGKALYAGISNYSTEGTLECARILKEMGTPFVLHQPKYSMFVRMLEGDLLKAIEKSGIGSIVFSPLAQGILTDRYLSGIPADSRAGGKSIFLGVDQITPEVVNKVSKLNMLATERGQSMAQMAIAWVLRDKRVTSALIGASSVEQLKNSLGALENLSFEKEELEKIDRILEG